MPSFFEFFPSSTVKDTRTQKNAITNSETFSEILGIDTEEFKNAQFKLAAMDPGNYILRRDSAYANLKNYINQLFLAYTDPTHKSSTKYITTSKDEQGNI